MKFVFTINLPQGQRHRVALHLHVCLSKCDCDWLCEILSRFRNQTMWTLTLNPIKPICCGKRIAVAIAPCEQPLKDNVEINVVLRTVNASVYVPSIWTCPHPPVGKKLPFSEMDLYVRHASWECSSSPRVYNQSDNRRSKSIVTNPWSDVTDKWKKINHYLLYIDYLRSIFFLKRGSWYFSNLLCDEWKVLK